MLTNSLKIVDTTKTEFLELIFCHSDKKIWQKNAEQIEAVIRTVYAL